jgi:hypothetical protein
MLVWLLQSLGARMGPCQAIKPESEAEGEAVLSHTDRPDPLWDLDIAELTGHNLEARGREEVNRLLQEGWRLLHIYTLKYQEDGVWRERPMAILGRPRSRAGGREQGAARAAASSG